MCVLCSLVVLLLSAGVRVPDRGDPHEPAQRSSRLRHRDHHGEGPATLVTQSHYIILVR